MSSPGAEPAAAPPPPTWTEERQKFAATVMVEVAKIVLTLAGVFLAFSVAFLQFLLPDPPTLDATGTALLAIALGAAVLSLPLGFLALGAIAAYADHAYGARHGPVRHYLRGQQLLFFTALAVYLALVVRLLR